MLGDILVAELATIYEIWHELVLLQPETLRYFFTMKYSWCPQWERWVRSLAEKPRHKVFITVSNARLPSRELGSSLTGRHRPISLMPFSFFEIREA